MAATDPGTRSPGHAFYKYTHHGKQRTLSFRLTNTVDPSIITPIGAEMATNAPFFAACMPTSASITGWGLKDNNGAVQYEASFETAFTGTKSVVIGWADYFSTMLTLQGRGGAVAFGSASGLALTRFHIGGTIQFLDGEKAKLGSTLGLAYTELANQLNLSTRFFADFYGQKADVQDRMPIQFNAHIQRHDGT